MRYNVSVVAAHEAQVGSGGGEKDLARGHLQTFVRFTNV
jgi:hypothetical protein